MARFTTTIDAPCAPDAAFAYLADLANARHWDPSIVEAERLDGDGPVGVGTRVRVLVAFFGRRVELTYRVAEIDPPRRVVFEAEDGRVRSRDVVTVEPAGDGCTVGYDAELGLKGPARLLDRGLQLAFDSIGKKAAAGLGRELARLEG